MRKKLVLIIGFLLIIPIISAIPFQGHPGDEISGEITEAIVSCAQLQQSDITDDSDFCLDLDTRCDATFPCTTLCLNGVCINSFSEINATGGSADLADDSVTTDHIVDETITTDDIEDGTITQDDLGFTIEGGSGTGYCPDGICGGDLYLNNGNLKMDPGKAIQFLVGDTVISGIVSFGGANQIGLQTNGQTHLLVDTDGKVRIGDTSTALTHVLGVKTNSGDSVIDISSIASQYSAVDFMEAGTPKWGIGKNPDNEFYIAEYTVADVVTITPGGIPGAADFIIDGNVGIGKSPSYKLDVNGEVNVETNLFVGGNVGIGTTSPQNKLNIVGGVLQVGLDSEEYHTIYDANGVRFNRNGVSYIDQAVVGGSLRFRTSDTGATDTDAITILSDGSVGIGTTNPTYARLEISSPTAGTAIYGDGGDVGVWGYSDAGGGIYGESDIGAAGWFYSEAGYGLIVEQGDIGIGTTQPASELHIQRSDVSGANMDDDDLLILENEGNTNINIISSASNGVGRLVFSDDEYNEAAIAFYHNGRTLNFQTADGGIVTINQLGDLQVPSNSWGGTPNEPSGSHTVATNTVDLTCPDGQYMVGIYFGFYGEWGINPLKIKCREL